MGRKDLVTNEEAQNLADLVNRAVKPNGDISAAELARNAGVAEGTVAKMRRGETVSNRSAEKVRAALGAPPVADAPPSAFPADVELVQKMVGMWLMGMPDEARAGAVYGLVRFMGGDPAPNGPSSEQLRWLTGR